jgi:hypothetical protein
MQSDPKQPESGNALVARKTGGNPEGKGLNGFLLDVYLSEPRGVAAKARHQILAELFTSMLVLSATFKYRPAVGTLNYLYRINGEWSLSLIAPEEWSDERRAGFAGTCVLHRDMTWTIAPSPSLADDDNPAAEAIRRFYEAFAGTLDTDLALEEILPVHVQGLPYYQRLYAYALSRSVFAAVTLGDQTSICCRQWRTLLPREETRLLACGA